MKVSLPDSTALILLWVNVGSFVTL